MFSMIDRSAMSGVRGQLMMRVRNQWQAPGDFGRTPDGLDNLNAQHSLQVAA